MLIKKHKMLYSIGREHNRLKQEMARLSDGEVLRERVVDQEVEEEVEAVMVEDEIEEDEAMQGHEEDYDEKEKKTKDELSEVDRYILEK